MVAIRVAGRPADEEHPYGHRRVENLSALGEAMLLVAGGVLVVVGAFQRLTGPHHHVDASLVVIAVVLVAISVDLTRIVVSVRSARHYRSAALRSNAFHFGADMIGSLVVLTELLVVRAGYAIADPVAALVVAAIIFLAAARLVWETSETLIDRAPYRQTRIARQAIQQNVPDAELRRLRMRESAGRYFIDIIIAAPPASALVQSHALADQVERAVHDALPESDVVVHVEPADPAGQSLTDQVETAARTVAAVSDTHSIHLYQIDGHTEASLHIRLPSDLSLLQADTIAATVEQTIKQAIPTISRVYPHLEPASQPLTATRIDAPTQTQLAERINTTAAAITGQRPRAVRLVDTNDGISAFITLTNHPATTLIGAHKQASAVEDQIHRQNPSITDIIIHTEPLDE